MSPIIHVGCSGFQKAQQVYEANFGLVEIQQTFYKPPLGKTATRWRAQAPENFIFTLKAWQLITHEPFSPTYSRSGLEIPRKDWNQYGSFRPTQAVEQAWQRTREIAGLLHAPIILFQCPAQFTPTSEHIYNLRSFFRKIDRGAFKLAWEPRGNWPVDQVRSLCQELDLIHAVDPFSTKPQYGTPTYFRMHGGKDYRYQYTPEDFRVLKNWCLEQEEVYCLFNNVSMWEDASRFQEILTAQQPA